jgi:sec-independent protein translocase protein TatC
MARLRNANQMTLSQHLAEARRRFLWCCVAIALAGVVAFILYNQILHLMQTPYCHASPQHCTFLITNPLDGLTLRIRLSLFGGAILATPVVIWHLWRFITPGLKVAERRYALPFVLCTMLFFALGVVVAYVTFNHALAWLASIGGSQLTTAYNPNQYLTLFALLMIVFGLTFEFPVVLVALELARIVTPAALLRQWRYAVIGITIFAAIVTPSSDPFSMLALAVPLVIFYFIAIGVGKMFRR